MNQFRLTLAVLGVTALSIGAAAAQPEATGVWRVSASVPVSCWVQPTGGMTAEADAQGQVIEACNARGGFSVSANYRPLANHERARLRYDNAELELSHSGSQVLRHVPNATIRRVSYQFDTVVLDSPLVLHLTIQPL